METWYIGSGPRTIWFKFKKWIHPYLNVYLDMFIFLSFNLIFIKTTFNEFLRLLMSNFLLTHVRTHDLTCNGLIWLKSASYKGFMAVFPDLKIYICCQHFSWGHSGFNCHFLKLIFDLLALNRFPNLHWIRDKKNHELVSAPYRPTYKLFYFLSVDKPTFQGNRSNIHFKKWGLKTKWPNFRL